MAPGTFMYIYIVWVSVYFAQGRAEAELLGDILKYGGGGVATILAVVLVTFFARREIKKNLDEDEEQKSLNSEGSTPTTYNTDSKVV